LIPVLLMLAYPPGYPNAAPVRGAQLRASDADRDTVVDMLCAAAGDGRLTLAELDGRVGAALSARTRAELLALISDLPGTPRSEGRATDVAPGSEAVPAGRRGRGHGPLAPGGQRGQHGRGAPAAARSGHPAPGSAARSGHAAARPAATAPSRWSLIQSLIDTWASPAPALPVARANCCHDQRPADNSRTRQRRAHNKNGRKAQPGPLRLSR
jgi:hypothetical protein